MSREKEDIGEVEVHPRAHFVFNALLALNFSFVLRVLWGFHGFGLHVIGWCFHSLRTSLTFCTGA
jgi:hypothetical protein